MITLVMYLMADSPKACRITAALTRLLQKQFGNKYALEIVDVLSQPQRTTDDGVFATPCIMKTAPGPTRTLLGDLIGHENVLARLGL